MDLFKRIQDLSAIYDDDGPSATVLESRPMFANGQLVRPSNDGSRPGYSGERDFGKTVEPNIRLRSGKYDVSYKGESLGSFNKITDARKVIKKAKEDNPRKKTGIVKEGSRGYFLRKSLDEFIKILFTEKSPWRNFGVFRWKQNPTEIYTVIWMWKM